MIHKKMKIKQKNLEGFTHCPERSVYEREGKGYKTRKELFQGPRPKLMGAGFTLVEVLVSMFVFSLVMMSMVGIFGQSTASFKSGKNIQANLEEAQFALNKMAKTIRTSSVFGNDGIQNNLKIFNYSLTDSNCIRYFSMNDKLMVNSNTQADRASCESVDFINSDADALIEGYVSNINFKVVNSLDKSKVDGPKAGRVTMTLKICESSDEKKCANIQSSVSLKDYDVSMTP
ncbi:MAG: hypothetical protein COU40_00270 [Candidatus Moranbacteria bacterium CG10_big_fil_rev_8_21_14_0_10_35_21]|nr:MAG: hypothetical protein COU40_00270 [Candidatus Moranbacteria bacterium CG10_big_fil_rev_8_21_14_0_10_35_21]